MFLKSETSVNNTNRSIADNTARSGKAVPGVSYLQQKRTGSPQSLNNNISSENVLQAVFIAITGPEVPAESTTLEEGAQTLMERYGTDTYYTSEDIENDSFEAPVNDDDIYLIAHGDNPAISLTQEAALGEKNGAQVKNTVKAILKKFTTANKGEQFTGRIILEGCHSAEPVIDESRKKAKKGSLLYDLQTAMLNDNFFAKSLAPEARIGGYLGQAFSSGEYTKGYGTANTEHPLTIGFQNRRGIRGTKSSDGSLSYDEEESFLESRWKQALEFGAPDKAAAGTKKKNGKHKK